MIVHNIDRDGLQGQSGFGGQNVARATFSTLSMAPELQMKANRVVLKSDLRLSGTCDGQ